MIFLKLKLSNRSPNGNKDQDQKNIIQMEDVLRCSTS